MNDGRGMDIFWQDKTIVAYIALQHHTRYITPVMDRLARSGASVVYLVGQAERSQEITAIERGLDYHHVFDFLADEDYPEIEKKYSAIKEGFARAVLNDVGFSAIAPTVLDKTLFASAQEFVAFKKFFIRFTPDLCFALHENNRWGKMFSFHAKKANVPFITLQEGLFTTSELSFISTGHIQNSTLGLLWGKGSRSYLCHYEAPEDRAIPAGNTLLANKIIHLKKNDIRRKKREDFGVTRHYVVLLLLSAILHPVEAFFPIFQAFSRSRDKRLLVKFHPITVRQTLDRWLESIPDDLKKGIRFIHGEENTYELIAMSDLCMLSDISTTGLEALAIGRPLVFIKLDTPKVLKSPLPGKGVALEYSPGEIKRLMEKPGTVTLNQNREAIRSYLADELTEPENSIENTIRIMRSVITAHQAPDPSPMAMGGKPDKQWSFIIPYRDRPELLLAVLESVAAHSNGHSFEVILVGPDRFSQATRTLLDSLKGEVTILRSEDAHEPFELFNSAASRARGHHLIFMDEHLAPGPTWLAAADSAIKSHGKRSILGGKVINRSGQILQAGMLLNDNHSPVSAFRYLKENYPPANEIATVQLIDRFMVIERDAFLLSGGFNVSCGRYGFLDLCLRMGMKREQKGKILYIPGILLTRLSPEKRSAGYDDAVYFYSRWHGALWSNEKEFYQEKGISPTELETLRLSSALSTT